MKMKQLQFTDRTPSPPKKKTKQKVMTIKWALLNINNCDKNNDKEF